MALSSPAAAVTVIFTDGAGGPLPGEKVIQNFNNGTSGASSETNAGIYNSSVPGVAAQPATGDQGDPFYAVLGGGSADFTFANPLSQVSFDYGSADTYNSFTISFTDGTSTTLSGQDIINVGTADGDQSSPRTNGRVSIFGDGKLISGIHFASRQNSLEFDNLAGSAVPEPATWGLMLFGFGAVGFGMRRRRGKDKLRIRYAV
jgi:hypothetical protein